MVVPTEGMWLCSRCAAVASASYEKDTSEATVVREQPSSSSSSYVGPLASTMLDEPYSDVLYMKPLRSLHGIYSNFSITYMLKHCRLSMQELMVRATGKLCSLRSHWSGLPLSINDWGTKLRHQPLVVDDATGVWSLETSVSRPGLVSKDEEYPGKKTFTQKWHQDLKDLFVPSQIIGTSDHTNAVERHWRFDVLEQLMKSNELQARPLPSALDHLTFLSWNAGVARQRLDPGAISGGSLHFGMMQEVDPQIVASLERWGAIVHVPSTDPLGFGKPTCTFARAAFIERSEQLGAHITLRSRSWGAGMAGTQFLDHEWRLLKRELPETGINARTD